MASVTQRIKEIKQPYGGYLRPSDFKKIQFEDNNELKEENIHSSLVGLTVDYMTRYIMGIPIEEAFKISLMGAKIINDSNYSFKLLHNINGLDNKSLYNACKLVGYDVCFRSGPMAYKDVKTIDADDNTINNIKIMIDRSIKFFEKYGPIVKDGFTFEGGYTNTINCGDGDFLTRDTLWDFKVSSTSPKSLHTLQLLVYYIMGKHSVHNEFDTISKLGIFNPRLNCIYIKEISEISLETIEIVSEEVICYNNIKSSVVANNIIYKDDRISLSDVMRILQGSRYTVMKYYKKEGLPLRKENNKYYIRKEELYDWIKLKEEERKKEQKIANIFAITLIVLIIFICTKLLKIILGYF